MFYRQFIHKKVNIIIISEVIFKCEFMTKKHKIIVYSTPTCPFCVRVKDFLKQNKIEFTEYDVSEDEFRAIEMFEKSGQMGVPVIDIDGIIIHGFDEVKIRLLLGI